MSTETNQVVHGYSSSDCTLIVPIKCELISRYRREAWIHAVVYSVIWFIFFPLVWIALLINDYLPKGVAVYWLVPTMLGIWGIRRLSYSFASWGPGTRHERITFVQTLIEMIRQAQAPTISPRPSPANEEIADLLMQQNALPRSLNYRLAQFIGLTGLDVDNRRAEWPVIAHYVVSGGGQIPAVRLHDQWGLADKVPELDFECEPFQTPFEPVELEKDTGKRGFPSAEMGQDVSPSVVKKQAYAYLNQVASWLLMPVIVILICVFFDPSSVFSTDFMNTWLLIAIALISIWSLQTLWPTIREEVYAVPGGLVVRRSGNYARYWQLQHYTPANAMLFIADHTEHHWLIIAPADNRPHVQIQLDKETLQSALNAWFSPLPPPREDELEDLC